MCIFLTFDKLTFVLSYVAKMMTSWSKPLCLVETDKNGVAVSCINLIINIIKFNWSGLSYIYCHTSIPQFIHLCLGERGHPTCPATSR